MKYIGMFIIGVIFTLIIWFLFALMAGETGDSSLLVMVVLTQNIIIVILLVYIIELIKKVRSPK